MRRAFQRGGLLLLGGATGVAATTTALAHDAPTAQPPSQLAAQVPSRAQQLRRLASGTAAEPFDVLVIGGGATGTGCALDAVTR